MRRESLGISVVAAAAVALFAAGCTGGGGGGKGGGAWVLASSVGSMLHEIGPNGQTIQTVDVGAITGRTLQFFTFDPGDGSFWLGTAGGSFYHLDRDFGVTGSVADLGNVPGGQSATALRESDGSLVVVVQGAGEIVRIATDGTIMEEIAGYNSLEYLDLDQADDAIWFNFRVDYHDHVGKLDRDRNLVVDAALTDSSGYSFPKAIAVSPSDGSAWFLCECYHCVGHDAGHLVGLDAGGTEIVHVPMGNIYGQAYAVTFVDPAGNIWTNDLLGERFVELSPTGSELASVALNSVDGFSSLRDGSSWVHSVYTDGGRVRKLDPSGVEIAHADIPACVYLVVQAIP